MANEYPFIMLPAQLFQEDLSGADFKVIGTLAGYTNKDRVCHVFVKTIAEKTGLTKRSVFTSLSKLEKMGYIKRQNNITNTYGANFYYIEFNPQPSEKNFTTLENKNSLPSEQNFTHIKELDLKELYLNSKNLKKAAALKNSNEGVLETQLDVEDFTFADVIRKDYPHIIDWCKIYKCGQKRYIKAISRNAEKRIFNELQEITGSYPIRLLNFNENIPQAKEILQ
jgi:predicted transcriptional regulator